MQRHPERGGLAVEKAPAHLGAGAVARIARRHVLELRHVPQAVIVAQHREREAEIAGRAEAVFELLTKPPIGPAAFADPPDVLKGDTLRASFLGNLIRA